jgi:hypothetical protein
VLQLGVPNGLPLTFHNSNSIPLTVTSVTVRLAAPIPTGCDGSNLTVNGSSLTSPVTVPESVLVAAHSAATSAQTLELIDKTAVNQDACQAQQLHFTYSGSAKYTDSTRTVLTAKPNPSKHGQSVTLKATVTSTHSHPHKAIGTVSFYRCTNSACTASKKIGSRTLHGGSASLKTTVLPIGISRLHRQHLGEDQPQGAQGGLPQAGQLHHHLRREADQGRQRQTHRQHHREERPGLAARRRQDHRQRHRPRRRQVPRPGWHR